MSFLHLQTILVGYVFSNLICLAVTINLWHRNHSRYPGLDFMAAHFAANFVGMLLLALRNIIPDLYSIVFGSGFLCLGLWLLYIGINRFLGRSGFKKYHIALISVYLLVQVFFTYIQPDLLVRNILFSIVMIYFAGQLSWELLHETNPSFKVITRALGIAAFAFCLVGAARIVIDLAIPPGADLLKANGYESFIFLSMQMLYIILTFLLSMSVNYRLHHDLEKDIDNRKATEAALQVSQEKFQTAFQASPDSIIISRLADGEMVDVNEGFTRITGYSRDEAVGRSTLDLGIWTETAARSQLAEMLMKDSRVHNFEFNARIKNGSIIRAEMSAAKIKLGNEDYMLSVTRDVSEKNRLDSVLHSRLRIWEYSITHAAVEVMQMALDEIEDLTSSSISFYHLVNEDQSTLALQAWSTRTKETFCHANVTEQHYEIEKAGVWVDSIRERKPVIHNNFSALTHRKGMPDGHAEVVRELVVPIFQKEKIVAILGVGNKQTDYNQQDVELVEFMCSLIWSIVSQKQLNEQVHQLNQKLEQLAMTDDLTGLANRRYFFARGNEEIQRTQRYETELSMIMLDIDHFKKINDNFGHETGDFALKSIAHILKTLTREVDLPSRLGGEEFAIILPNTDLIEAGFLAERLRKAIEQHQCCHQQPSVKLTASFGVAAFHPGMIKMDELFRLSDSAMYQAKRQGRNQVVVHQNETV